VGELRAYESEAPVTRGEVLTVLNLRLP
jgi:hypothetical protein